MALKPYQNLSTQATGSSTKLRAEQVRSEDGLGSLAIDLEALRGQVKDIIGAADYKEEIVGEYAKVQMIDLADHIDASSGSADLIVKKGLEVTDTLYVKQGSQFDGFAIFETGLTSMGNVAVDAQLTVSGVADFNGNVTAKKISIDSDVATRLYIVDGDGSMKDESKLTFSGTELKVDGAVSGSSATFAGETVMASATVSDLTNNRVVLAGTGGELKDSIDLQYNGTKLIVGPNKFEVVASSGAVSAGNITAATGSFSGNLSVAGDLQVNGALTYVNTTNLQVTDKKVVIANGATGNDLNDAGIYLGSDANVDESIRWVTADGGKWVASDMFAADTLQALDLSSAIVWADATGSLVEISNADLGAAIKGRLTDGMGVDLSLDNATGVTTISIGQEVYTASNVTFGSVTGSNLTASRLMASDVSKKMVSVETLSAWFSGTAGSVSVKDEADGKLSIDTALVLTSTGNTSLSGSYASVAAAINDLWSKTGAASKKATFSVEGAQGVAKDENIAGAWCTFLGELGADNSLVFVNGQLMDATGDYTLGGGALSFKFKLEQGDLVTVKKG